MDKVSFIIPCYRSQNTVRLVINEIIEIMKDQQIQYEILPVNDCSPDNVWEVLKEIAVNHPNIKPICLAKNMNRTPAILAGCRYATGDYVVILDDDGQCPADRLFELIEPLHTGYDVAIAKYPIKKQSKFKNWGSNLNARMAEQLIGKPKQLQISNFMAMKKFVVDEIIKYTHPYPYLSGLILRTTQKIVNVPMEERERSSGSSTYTFKKLVQVWMNGFTAFSVKPLRISSLCGLICAVSGFILALYTMIHKICHPNIQPGYSSIMAVLLVISGLIMIMLGIIGEYIGRIYICINNSPQYVIKEKINFDI